MQLTSDAEAPPAAATTRTERVAVLSMNIFARPEWIHSGKWFSAGDNKDLRITLLLRKMRDFDIVILQEMFEVGVRQKWLLREAKRMGFAYHCGSVYPGVLDRRLIDGGLLILSRFPIVERSQLAFSQGSGSDGVCAKGVLFARIQLSPDLGDSLLVFTTHTQAGDGRSDYSIRLSQIQEMHQFIRKIVRSDRDAPVLITGDLNLDARHDLSHDPLDVTGRARSTACLESKVYQQLVCDLEMALGAGRTVTDLMKHYDTTKVGDAKHPITNGDGHASLQHVSDPYALDKDGKCIDYMFFSAGARRTGSNSLLLRVVETRTTVDRCDVAPLIEDPTSQSQLLPITHLSDHYALTAEFKLELPVATSEMADETTSLVELLQQAFPPRAFAQTPQRLWLWKISVALLGAAVGVVAVVGTAVCAAVGAGRT